MVLSNPFGFGSTFLLSIYVKLKGESILINGGDTALVLISAAFVFIMTPALGFFYSGPGRRKNAVSNLMNSFFILGLAIVLWFMFGYSLAFGPDHGHIIGDFSWAFFRHVGFEPGPYAETIPHLAYAAFQMMFAIITPALITGAIGGRMRFKSLFFFILFWSIIVYYPMAHLVWGHGGWLGEIGVADFAGGDVVHISSGVTALLLCIILGRRKDLQYANYRTHNIPFVALGAAFLWFGWFGFNGGSALAANGLAAHAFMTSAISSAAALLSWMMMDVIYTGKPTLVGACTGLVVGLVAITPGCGFVPAWASLIIGLLVSPLCYYCVSKLKPKLGYDDALDAFGCHGIGGIYGGIMTGLFGSKAINPNLVSNGLIYGDGKLFLANLLGVIITIAISLVGTLICVGLTKLCAGDLRVSEMDEKIGLDVTQHGERAYPSFNGLDD